MRTQFGIFLFSFLILCTGSSLALAEHSSSHTDDGVASHGSEEGTHETAEMNWFEWNIDKPPALGFMFINFVLLTFLVYRILRKPIGGKVKARKESLETALAEANSLRDEAQKALASAQEKMEAMDLEMARLRAEILDAGKTQAERIAKEAQERGARMESDTNALVEQEIARMAASIKREVVEKVIDKAMSLLSDRITTNDRERLAKEYVESMETIASRAEKSDA